MASCDAAIGAGGTTQWERACIGIPSLVFSIANNQTKICEDMSEVGNILYGGVVYNAKSIEFILKTFIENQFLRKLLHIKSKSLIDSKFNLSSLFFQENTVQLRKATIEDCKNIYDWRNHQQTRKYSGNSEIIPYETHQAWYQTAIIDEKKIFLIARDNDKEIGVLRYDFMSDTILISIYLNPQYNGYGYGKKLLESGEVYLKTNKICFKTMVAEVLNDNTPSHKLFKKCGFKNYKSVYKKILNES
jgi:ribosomal protein S18 acetylase RimI-like enzyme